jgi:hypothetical protein
MSLGRAFDFLERRNSFPDVIVQSIDQLNWFWNRKPNRVKVLHIYFLTWLRKLLYANHDSWPYISGNAFASISDLVINNRQHLLGLSQKEIRSAQVVFIQADLFDLFLDKFVDLISGDKVLITGNSDREFLEVPFALKNKEFVWFAQNSHILGDSRVYTIPIGVENIKLGVHGTLRHLRLSRSFKQNRILFGPMGNTHLSRVELLTEVIHLQHIFCIPPTRVDPRAYVRRSSRFKYVFCPRGNGVDTHRLWESLYRGQTPIIFRSAWADSLSALKLPILEVSNLEELIIVAPELDYYLSDFNPDNLEVLWMPYWKNKIDEILNSSLA